MPGRGKEPLRPGDPGYVGRGHPPKQHQFKKGECGNTRGRPKGRHRHETRMRKYLSRDITLSDGRSLSPQELIVAGLQKLVAKGDARAIDLYVEYLDRYCKPEADDENRPLDPERRRRMMEAARRLPPQDEGPLAADDTHRDAGDEAGR